MDQGQNASDGGQNGFAAIKRIIACIIALMMPLFFAGIAFSRTATTVEQKIADKMLYQGVYRCYTDGYIVSSFNPIDPNYQDVNSFVTNKAGDENYVPLITGLNSSNIGKTATYKVSDSGLSCKQFIVGGHYFFGGSNKSILEATNHIAPQIGQPEQVEAFLKNMGYSIIRCVKTVLVICMLMQLPSLMVVLLLVRRLDSIWEVGRMRYVLLRLT